MLLTRVLLLLVMAVTGPCSGGPRDFKGKARRRKRAAQLFGQGRSQIDVARLLEVSRQTVSRWYTDRLA